MSVHHHHYNHHHTKNVYITNTTTNEGARPPRKPRLVRFPRDPKQEAKKKRREEKLAAMGPTEREMYDEKLRRKLEAKKELWIKKMERLDRERLRRCGYY